MQCPLIDSSRFSYLSRVPREELAMAASYAALDPALTARISEITRVSTASEKKVISRALKSLVSRYDAFRIDRRSESGMLYEKQLGELEAFLRTIGRRNNERAMIFDMLLDKGCMEENKIGRLFEMMEDDVTLFEVLVEASKITSQMEWAALCTQLIERVDGWEATRSVKKGKRRGELESEHADDAKEAAGPFLWTRGVDDGAIALLGADPQLRQALESAVSFWTVAEAKEIQKWLRTLGNMKVSEYSQKLRDALVKSLKQIQAKSSHSDVPHAPIRTRVLDSDRELREAVESVIAICGEDEFETIRERIARMDQLLRDLDTSTSESIADIFRESARTRDEIMHLVDRIRPEPEFVPDVVPLKQKEEGATHLSLSDMCHDEPFRHEMFKLFSLVEKLKNPEPERPRPPPPIPLGQMSDEEQIEYMELLNPGPVFEELPVEKHARPGWIGIRNMGRTCYLSAILQVLLHAAPFRDLFMGPDVPAQYPNYAASSMANIAGKMWLEAQDHEGEPITPSDLLCALHQASATKTEFVLGTQSDAHELINVLFNELDSAGVDIKRVLWNRIESRRGCETCGTGLAPTVADSYEMMVSLPETAEFVDLGDCISARIRVEHFACCGNSLAFETSSLLAAGSLLLIQLGRFDGLHGKKNTIVNIPLVLTVPVGRYRLIGVVNHKGIDRESGHYTAMVYHDGDKVWLNADDRKVEDIGSIDESLVSSDAYLLLYQLL